MTKYQTGAGVIAPVLLALAQPAHAQQADPVTITGQSATDYAPSGMMGDHVHDGGTFMVGLEWRHADDGGTNLRGHREASDAEIAAAGYTARTQAMTMDMAMLHLMYAPDDRLTLMAMPMWMRMKMTMVGIGAMPMMPTMPGMDHHMLMPGETMTHATEGFGDTEVGALYALVKQPTLEVIAGTMVSIPTGKIDRTNEDGSYVHYGMQSGSGTWDLVPSLTVKGHLGEVTLGVQGRYRLRTGDENKSGFKFGDVAEANLWASVPVARRLAASARLGLRDEGIIEGHYNAGHHHASPPDRQGNYGGFVIDAGLGTNLLLGSGLRLGGEVSVPLRQDLNGYQAPRNWASNLSVTKDF